MADPVERVISVARAERDHAAALLVSHQRTCMRLGCDLCQRLKAHLERTHRQVELLEPEPVEDTPLW